MDQHLDPVTRELVAISAAVAGHCAPCFNYHFREAVALGVSLETIQAIVSLARGIRQAGSRHMDEYVERRIAGHTSLQTGGGSSYDAE